MWLLNIICALVVKKFSFQQLKVKNNWNIFEELREMSNIGQTINLPLFED